VPTKGEPKEEPNYLENAIKSVDLPILGGPFYLKTTTAPGSADAVVLARSEVNLSSDPLAKELLEITEVFKSRALADAALASYLGRNAYTYYIGPRNLIYPTIISDTTAPQLCRVLRQSLEIERQWADALANFGVDLALWYVGARAPIQTSEPPATGRLIGGTAGRALSQAETRILGKLIQEGHTVEILPESPTARTADFLVDGVKTEAKAVSNLTSKDLSGALGRRILEGAGQAPHVIVDTRGQAGMTEDLASRAIRRAYGADAIKRITLIRIIGDNFDIAVSRM
jgi:hypothetical protein